MSDSFDALVTALADDELIIGHRHSEWTGYAPHIEEDVAFASIAQDEIGHASSLYSLVGGGSGPQVDALALGRQPEAYRNAVLCERPNRDWAFTLARHWLYDHADDIRLEALEQTSDSKLQQLVTKIRREERYHLLHADYWMKRVAQGPVDARSKIIPAMSAAFAEAGGLFEPFEQEDQALDEGWLPLPSSVLLARFMNWATSALDELGLPGGSEAEAVIPAEFVASSSGDLIAGEDAPVEEPVLPAGVGGRRGRHTSDLAGMWAEMTTQYRENEGARW
ncbi:MAG: ring,2-phenylacetyl-CoA epoxidase subunit PaaC [Actinomycetota bacterium]|jgi:ring-1,2-phenylacetyl-CoA epoxidase subunit PaaC|nr:ring,2-phenylacetyl-CoA epoxidase subunit PaaC [Actinomycetota bacterium]